jgi:hypothetical protein
MASRWLDYLTGPTIGSPVNLQSFLALLPYRAHALGCILGKNVANSMKWAALKFLAAP